VSATHVSQQAVNGGLEQVVWDLACGLTGRGHKMLLFAPKGSQAPSKGFLIETPEPALKVHTNWREAEQRMYDVYKKYLTDFEGVIHGHGWFGFEYLLKRDFPNLHVCHTHHGHISWKSKAPVDEMNLVGISEFMMHEYQSQNWSSRYVHNGINLDKYPFKAEKGERLVFVGRIDKFKQPHVAIEVARKLGMGLDLVGGTFVQDSQYLERIRKMCDGKQICFYPDASHELKLRLLQNAKALLFPSNMKEPFGLVLVEANACGTPVVASRDGAIPELLQDGVNGFLCDSVDDMVEALKKIGNIKPEDCHRIVKDNYTREIMAQNYLKLYRDVLHGKEW